MTRALRTRRAGARSSVRALPVLVALAAVLGPTRSEAGQWSGRFEGDYGRSTTSVSTPEGARAPDAGGDSFALRYTLRFDQQVFDPIGYDLTLRVDDQRTYGAAGGVGRTVLLAPTAGVRGRVDRLSFRVSYDGIRDSNALSATPEDQWSHRLAATSRYALSPELDLGATGDHQVVTSSDPAGDGTTSDRVTVLVDGRRGGLRIIETNRFERLEQPGIRFTRSLYGPSLRAQYAGGLLDGKLDFVGAYAVDYARTEERTTSDVPVEAPRELDNAIGIYIADDTPENTELMPRLDVLVDRNVVASTGIAIGTPDGASFQNVGVNMQRVVVADELQIVIRDGSGRLIASGRPVEWTVYTSQDGLSWTRASTSTVKGVPTEYDPAQSQWALHFDATPAQYFKAVNLGTLGPPPAFVTEIRAIVHELITPQSERTLGSLYQTAFYSVQGRPVRGLMLSYGGSLNDTATSQAGLPTVRLTDWMQQVGASVGPFAKARFDTSYAYRNSSAPGQDRSGRAANARLAYDPIRELGVALDGSYSDERIDAFTAQTRSTGLRGRAQILPTLSVTAGVEANRQTRSELEAPFLYYQVDGRLNARVTRTLDLSASAFSQWLDRGTTGGTVGASPLPVVTRYAQYWVEAALHSSVQLQLVARVGYTEAVRSGILQNYRVAWNPFSDGALQLTVNFDTDVDLVNGSRFQRLYVAPRWALNSRTALEVQYSTLRQERDAVGVQRASTTRTEQLNVMFGINI